MEFNYAESNKRAFIFHFKRLGINTVTVTFDSRIDSTNEFYKFLTITEFYVSGRDDLPIAAIKMGKLKVLAENNSVKDSTIYTELLILIANMIGQDFAKFNRCYGRLTIDTDRDKIEMDLNLVLCTRRAI